MSTELTVSAKELSKYTNVLKSLFPSGQKQVPVGIKKVNDTLVFTCTTGCVFQCRLHLIGTSESYASTSILYTDVSQLIPNSGNVTIEFTNTGIVIECNGFEASFPICYSTVRDFDFGSFKFNTLPSAYSTVGLRELANTGLDRMYHKSEPIHVYNDVAMLKYPNIWIQTRTQGMPFTSIIDIEQAKLVCRFEPNEVCITDPNSLTFKNELGYLQIPRKAETEENKLLSMMEVLSDVVTLNFDGYLDKVRNIAKFDSRAHCKVILYRNGIKTSISYENISFSTSAGDVTSEVCYVFTLPIQLWTTFVKTVGSGTVQILYGGDLICMRTHSVIILAHAIL